MIVEDMTIQKNECIALNTFEMVISGEEIPLHIQSGQFVHIQIGDGKLNMLRRPLSIADINRISQTITLIYHVTGDGTKWLSTLTEGTILNVLGPLGNGFEIKHSEGNQILVVGGGVGVPPLYHLTKQLVRHYQVTVVLGFATREAVFYEDEFRELTKTYISTDDGTYGHKGFVTDVVSQLDLNFQHYYACGPMPMLQAVQEQMIDTPGQLSFEERMGCGIGACFACVCEAKNDNGYVKICQDGPVLQASEVIL
ncbi:dihydroorotate dehydrogenase electron transfer subunit [Alkalibacillus salilacus]|uniref:Dihydroorotate dehydrogenase B (NAD(+)), electron transfer subunit n=1 Tax=Alkalibacillus salilacus TaxID=284582 RepID=A0ABT9VDW5_9BACI|nr:dihydroorotate dehydrogenase electron transfer subunit [Alkalibacillus salilacus]MDQ0159157.1 dihydroorotate dehydrogenase electron transfer subunit [Alkalibacillus salilacus]